MQSEIDVVNILESIMWERRADVEVLKRKIPQEQLLEKAFSRVHHSLRESIADAPGTAIIAEVKKASPSAGVLRDRYDPAATAEAYRDAGACGISVLTEPKHFLGSGRDLEQVRAAVNIPVLRKDFICDSYQVTEALAWGADVILLIVAALEWHGLVALYDEALEKGLEVLVESHSSKELEKALSLPEAIIGVNSRDLTTLRTDISRAVELGRIIPSGRMSIAESGIKGREDIELLNGCGYDGFLIGESLLRRDDVGMALKALL